MKTLALEFDDTSPFNHRLDLFEELRKRYPGFKVTFFAVAWDIRFDPQSKGTPITEARFRPFTDYLKMAVYEKWVEVCIHGLTHAPREFENLTFDEAKKRVLVASKMFANVGVPTQPIFKAPQWLLNPEAKKGVESLGYKVVEDGYYNWNVKDDFPPRKSNIIGHGHVQDVCGNGVDESFMRLCQIPKETKFKFISEVL